MVLAIKKSGFLKSLIIIGILAVVANYLISGNLFSLIQILSTANAKQNDSLGDENIAVEEIDSLPEELRASAQIDWSIIYGGSRLERTQIDAAILEAAGLFEVKADLLRAVIMTESLFNPRAVSNKGAHGLMQLMPKTAQSLGVTNPHNPRENILGGASYLASLIKEFDGDARLALAAYNAGPQAIHSSNNKVPREILPYVNRVMSYYRFFSGKEF